MNDKIIKVGISHGDINGISYELIIKAFDDIRMFEFCIPIVYGSSKILAYHRKAMDLPPVNINTISNARDAGANRINVINCGNEETTVEFSKSSPEAQTMAQNALERAINDLNNKIIDVLLIAPSNIDEMPYLLKLAENDKKPLKILVNNSLRIALVSDKMPLSEVSKQLTTDLLLEKLRTLRTSLVHDFMITLPRIALLSFNPGMGVKEQQFGKEETEILIPALKTANDERIVCFGPYSAGDFFGSGDYRKFDAILAVYYDQAIVPFRSISLGEGASYVANLPFVITTPDQGVSYTEAGKNTSSEIPFRSALYLVSDVFHTRQLDKEMNANPLKKQYFERGSDNEKLYLTKDE
jgi:4-hydroxythreonine-4-phosphate dehydrogenase